MTTILLSCPALIRKTLVTLHVINEKQLEKKSFRRSGAVYV